MTMPTTALFGTVTYKQVGLVEDTDADADAQLDAEVVLGTVTFTPAVSRLDLAGEDPPVRVLLRPLTYDIAADGVLRDDEGNDSVTLIATDTPAANAEDWTWTASFDLVQAEGFTAPAPYAFHLPADTNVDLTAVAPVSSSAGTPIIQGPQGLPGESAYEVAVENGFTGTEEEWLESLVGPEGPEGPPGSVDAVASTDITDSTATGRALITAEDPDAALTTIGAAPAAEVRARDISPTAYGASPAAAAADNAAAFIAALADAGSAGARLAVPGGQFTIDEALEVTGDVPIYGMSSVWSEIVCAHTGSAFVTTAPGVRHYGWSIRDLRITGDDATNAGSVGIDLDSISYADLRNLNISGFETGVSLHSAVSGGAVYNRLYDVTASACGTGVSIGAGGNATTLVTCRANANTVRGVSIVDANNCTLVASQIESNAVGLYVGATSDALSDYNTATACRFESNTTAWQVASSFVRDTLILAPRPFGTYAYSDAGTRTQHLFTGYDRIRNGITSNHTLTADAALYGVLHVTAGTGITVTVPQDSAAAIGQEQPIAWRQYGAGQITFAAGTGATLVSRGSAFKSAGQYAEGLLTKVGANTWLLSGDITT